MTDHIIDGRATGRRQLLQLLRDVCTSASSLCDNALVASGRWPDRAKLAIKSCVMLQRGLVGSHPQLADDLHILATEIQIALAAQSNDELFVARIQKIKDAIHRLQQSNIEGGQAD